MLSIVQQVLDGKAKIDVLHEQGHVGCCQIEIDLVVDLLVDFLRPLECSLPGEVAELSEQREVLGNFGVNTSIHCIGGGAENLALFTAGIDCSPSRLEHLKF